MRHVAFFVNIYNGKVMCVDYKISILNISQIKGYVKVRYGTRWEHVLTITGNQYVNIFKGKRIPNKVYKNKNVLNYINKRLYEFNRTNKKKVLTKVRYYTL